MKLDNEYTRDLEDMTALAHPAPSWWKVAFTTLLILLACAGVGVIIGGCGPTDSVDRLETADAGVTQNAIAVTMSPGALALTFGGTSYSCNGTSCSCGLNGEPFDDCRDMILSGLCQGRTICTFRKSQSSCICREVPPSTPGPGCSDLYDPGCAVAAPSKSVALYQLPFQVSVMALIRGDYACVVPSVSLAPLAAKGVPIITLSPAEANTVMLAYAGHLCSRVELDLKANDYPDGHYQHQATTIVYKKVGGRMCQESSPFWNDQVARHVLGAPSLTVRTPAGMDVLFARYATDTYVEPCNSFDK